MQLPTRWGLSVVAVLLFAAGAGAAEGVQITPDVVYGHKHGMALTFDVFTPEEPNGAGVLFMVSGGWYSRWAPPEQAAGRFGPMLEKGFTVFAVRHGSSPKYVIPEILKDVRRSVRFIRLHAERFGVDPERLGVTGGSAGGHLSLMLGTTADDGDRKAGDEVLRATSRVAAVVAYFPPTDVRPWVDEESSYWKNYPALRFDAGQAAACSPVLHVTADDPPTLLIHGDRDKLVPLDHSEKIREEFGKSDVPCELLIIEGAAHGFRGPDAEQASDATVAWFEKHLAK
ncbi:MAG: prolyl oligopeptidase family serine peptidase [Planctomycetota bacterium]|jgi:acetyl esterase/lipase